ncbi:SRPBCC family protein [Streptomyces sp. NPDC018693]|uniref:SRPBCC family protein n=1 Tax=unclassified Streptomyces TaxID=2593676 RepID=UPI0037993492
MVVRRLRPVGVEFVESAPVRMVFAREMSASPESVFRALAEDVAGWADWFSAVTRARPTAGGREVWLRGGARFQETVLVAEAPEIYAYRVDVTNVPGVRALVEEWRVVPAGRGSRVQWTFVADGSGAFRAVLRMARPGWGRAFREAVTALDRRLGA